MASWRESSLSLIQRSGSNTVEESSSQVMARLKPSCRTYDIVCVQYSSCYMYNYVNDLGLTH